MQPSPSFAPRLILASSSRYRAALLRRLEIPFEVIAPCADETPLPGETPRALAERLAFAKAASLKARHADALIIGCDQIACLEDRLLGKPSDVHGARAQLAAASGRWVHFYTAVSLLDARSGRCSTRLVEYQVRFRTLTSRRIDAYLARESPLDCAGSLKAEGLGISLLAEMRGSDPTALIGLPLIALCDLLESAGVSVLG